MNARRTFLVGLSSAALVPAGPASGTEGRMEPVDIGEVSVGSLRAALDAGGHRAVSSSGSVAAEIWLVKQIPKLDDGVLVGLVRLTSDGHDVRERSVPAGTYTLRYSALPAGDRHDGCMRNPEFVVLIRASDDGDADRRLAYDEMMTLSGQILGRRHPVAWQVQRGRGHVLAPAFHEEREELAWMVVPLEVGSTRVPLSVFVRGSLSR